MGKKEIKISLKMAIILIVIFILVVGIIIYFCTRKEKYTSYTIIYEIDNYDKGFLGTGNGETYKYKLFENYSNYLQCVNNIDDWADDMFDNYLSTISKKNEYSSIQVDEDKANDYKEHLVEVKEEIKKGFNQGNYTEDYFKKYNLLLVERTVFGQIPNYIKLEDVCIKDRNLNVYIKEKRSGGISGGFNVLFFVTIPKEDMYEVKKINIDVDSKKPLRIHETEDKPIIYLYPTKDTKVSVKLKYKDNITVSYPKYIDGWEVYARTDGTLTDLNTNRNLYSLYYESQNKNPFKMNNEGFVVKGTDTSKFLEEKLEILGLNEREAEEFIIYWLPKLEENKYNYIRFASIDEINKNMPLEVNPSPDTIIRVLMTYKGLDNSVNVKEQQLTPQKRKGFTLVEWGGTEIK